MANIKISQLPEVTSLEATDAIGFVRTGLDGVKTNKKISITNFLTHIDTDVEINSGNISGLTFSVNGSSATNDLLLVDSTTNRVGIKNSSPQELLHVANGNVRIGGLGGVGDTATGVFIESKEKLLVPGSSGTANLLMSTGVSEISLNGSSTTTYEYVVGIGVEGQTKTIYISDSVPASFTVTLNPSTGDGVSFLNVSAAGIKLTKKGSAVILKAITSTKWVILGSNYAEFVEG
jgi:hypothetical protein